MVGEQELLGTVSAGLTALRVHMSRLETSSSTCCCMAVILAKAGDVDISVADGGARGEEQAALNCRLSAGTHFKLEM